jgi:hypothetical protein
VSHFHWHRGSRPPSVVKPKQKIRAKGTEQFKSVFDTRNLTGKILPEKQKKGSAKGNESLKSVFSPQNLKKSVGTGGD